jgi:hypothetical protein
MTPSAVFSIASMIAMPMWMLDQNKELKINQLLMTPCLF